MTALAADKKVTMKQDDKTVSYFVKAAAQIYLGAMVTIKADGYAYAGTNTSGDIFVGIALENVLGVTDDVERVKVDRRPFLAKCSGLTIDDVGLPCFLADDNLITVTPNNVLVGVILGCPSATTAWVRPHASSLIDDAPATLTVAGAATVGTSLTAADLAATDDLTVGDDCAITGLCTVGETLAVTGVATFTAPPVIPTVVFGSLGSAAQAGQICYCATGDGGNPGLLITDGSNWLAMSDGATAAET